MIPKPRLNLVVPVISLSELENSVANELSQDETMEDKTVSEGLRLMKMTQARQPRLEQELTHCN